MNAHETTKVSEAMTASVHTIDAMATVKDAIQAMREHGVSSLAVERRDEHDEFGLLVITDIARDVIALNRAAERVQDGSIDSIVGKGGKPRRCRPAPRMDLFETDR